MRITPENLTELSSRQRVSIGTNESGIHGAGIAQYAFDNWGLVWGQGFGPSGMCFGVPTKDWRIGKLDLGVIDSYISRYIQWMKATKYNHLVTKVGCGLAGYTPNQIAPMFAECINMTNVWLPEEFIKVISNPMSWDYIIVKSSKYGTEPDDIKPGY